MASSSAIFDFIVFGASGFTGRYVVEEVLRVSQTNPIKWAVAGRNSAKLSEAVKNAYEMAGRSIAEEIPIIIADVSDEESLNEMCKKAKVVLNCTGPYRFFGEPVVKACITNKAHHVDISGEALFLEKMQLDYHAAAKDAGVYVVGAAGFDSVPIETLIHHLQNQFSGEIDYLETFYRPRAGPEGMKINTGTWVSAVNGIGDLKMLKPLRQQLFPDRLPTGNFSPPKRKPLFYSDEMKSWCLHFPSPDKSVVMRTQHYLYSKYKMRPFYFSTYLQQRSLLSALGTIFFGLIFLCFTSFSFGRRLLEKYPEFFSFGLFTNKGPTREQVKGASFIMTVVGVGHSEKLSETSDVHSKPPDVKLRATINGPEAGYIATPIAMVQCGLTILQEKEKLPDHGGVYTPGAAFFKTTLLDRLQKNGFEYHVEQPVKLEN